MYSHRKATLIKVGKANKDTYSFSVYITKNNHRGGCPCGKGADNEL